MAAIVNVCVSYKLSGIDNILSAVGSSVEGFDIGPPSAFGNTILQLQSSDRGNNPPSQPGTVYI
jgi:hypothetical protein